MTLIHRIILMQKRAVLLGRKRQRKEDQVVINQINEEHDVILKNIIESHKKEIARLQENHDMMDKNRIDQNEKSLLQLKEVHLLEIKKMQKQHDVDVSTIRNQVKNHYDPLLQERNDEISRLNAEKTEQKKYYKSILDYGIAMENSGERAAGYFTRAQSKVKESCEFAMQSQNKFSEAMQLIDRGNSCVEAIQQTVGKTTPRLLKNIKE